jgi:beta-N-acetylhexosaminidase
VRSGEIPPSRIEESARRILETKQRMGILNWQPLDPAGAAARLRTDDHVALLTELFQRGVSLAQDRADLLPLRPGQRKAIIFPGTRYQIMNECQAYDPDIRWVVVSDQPSSDEIGRAVEAANASDVAVVWTWNARQNTRQADLVNALPQEKTVAVAYWSPYDLLMYPNVAGYMATYSLAREAIPAACAILFGALPAEGRLAVTVGALSAGSRAD